MRSALLLLVLLGVAPLGAQNAQVRNGSWVSFGLGFGFAHVAKVSKAKSAATVITLRVISVLFGLIGPAIQSLRK